MADASEDAVEFFENLNIPFPVYKPAEGQLKNDIEYALERLQQCSASAVSENVGLQLKYALVLQYLDRRDEATAMFKLIKDSTDVSIRARIIACVEIGISSRSKSELEAAIRLAEEHPGKVFDDDEYLQRNVIYRGKYHLGRLLYQEKDFANAARYLEAGLSYWRTGYELNYLLGASYGRTGNYSKAVEHLQACIKIGNSDSCLSDVYQELGDVYFSSAQYHEAAEAFAKSAKLIEEDEGDLSTLVSFRWWSAGNITAEKCQDHERAAQYLISSLKAALKIQDPEKQAERLMAGSTWLHICIRAKVWSTVLDQLLQEKTLEHVALSSSVHEPLKTLRAEAYGTLGLAMLSCQAFEEAGDFLEIGLSLLTPEEGCLVGSRETELSFRFLWAQAALYSVLGDYPKALQAFEQCKLKAPSESGRLHCEIKSCFMTRRMGNYVTAATMFAKVEVENRSLLATEPELKAELLLGLGQSILGAGNVTQALEHLEAARDVLEDQGCFTSEFLPLTYAVLYTGLILNGLFVRAFELISRFQAVVNEHHKESDHRYLLQIFEACTSRLLIDNEASIDSLTDLLEVDVVKEPQVKFVALSALADTYRNQENFEAAEDKYNEAIDFIPADDKLLYSQLYINRAELYRSKAVDAAVKGDQSLVDDLYEKALRDYNEAIQILEELQVLPLDLASAYAGQAVVLFHTKDCKAAGEQLDKAEELSVGNPLLLAKIKRVRAHIVFSEPGKFQLGMQEAREAALLFAEVQAKLEHLESSWISLLEGDMKYLFFLLQKACVNNESYCDALLWAERGRMRLYFHLADRRLENSSIESSDPGSLTDPLAFDRDDERARKCIASAVQGCGTGCLVVEYSCSPDQTELYIFIVWHDPQEGLIVKVRCVLLREFFIDQEQNRGMGNNLNALITKTRTEIKRKSEAKAEAGLGTLYRLLLQPVWEVVKEQDFHTIIFAPHGSIWLVPFPALYDEGSSRFLIEKVKVGVVPSLRALQRCQARHEEMKLRQRVQQAFVAGDPDPMGLRCGQLRGARQEAIQVAERLSVVPIIGRDMTKKTVVEGLESDCSVITLVTHGVVNGVYRHGALVMQGKIKHQQQKDIMREMVDIERQLMMSNVVSSNVLQQSTEVLTSSEIEKLDVRAALVVLSACQTGEGAILSEGLLGLARAVLQAGASCAVVTLWKVDDEATKELMTGMFEELVNSKTSVVEALRFSMLKLLKSGAPVYKWASAAAVGFSMLRITPE